MAEGQELCNHCGAPRTTGFAACKYCKTPYPGKTQANAIPCPRCNTLNEWGAQRCAQCQTWIVVQCVFCSSLSPHNAPACLKCGEAFAGAPERFAQRQSQQRWQQGLNVAGQVAGVAANVVGAAAAVGVIGGGHHHHHHHHGHYGGHHEGYSESSESGGFFDNLFDSGADTQTGEESGGFFDNLFGGDSSSSDDSGGFFDDD